MARPDKCSAQDNKSLPLRRSHLQVAAHPARSERYGAADVDNEDDLIAVVDDCEVVRDALDQLLVSVGYRTELYASAEEFMRAAEITRAACLVVDVELGGTSGPQLLRDLSARGLHFRAILMSASGDPAVRRMATELGCLTFLPKPFAPNDLLEVLARRLAFGCH